VKKKRARIVSVPSVSAKHADAAKKLKVVNAAAVNHKIQSEWIWVHIIYIVINI
jgi:hypothetical protein